MRQAAEAGVPRPAALHNLGFALEQLGRLDEAEAAYGDAAGRAKEDARIMLGWSIVALKRGDNKVAQSRLARACELLQREAGTGALVLGGHSGGGRDWTMRKMPCAQPSKESRPTPTIRFCRTIWPCFSRQAATTQAAETMLRSALAEDAALPQVSKNLGDIFYRKGRYDEAGEAYERAAKLNPELGDDLYFKLGNIAYKRRDHGAGPGKLGSGHRAQSRASVARANLEMLDLSQ